MQTDAFQTRCRMKLLFLLLPAGALLVQAQKAPSNGPKVINADPGWTFDGSPIDRDHQLPATAQLEGPAGTTVILDCDSSVWLAYSCGAGPCNIPACANPVPGVIVRNVNPYAHSPQGKSLTALFHSLFSREPKSPETAAARSGGNPSDAVVLQTAQGIHWGPALQRVLEGQHCFRLSQLPVRATGLIKTFTLDWDRSAEAEGVAQIPGLMPGAYAIEKGTPGPNEICRIDSDGVPAWVVVTPEADFRRVSAEWKDASAWLTQLEQSGAGRSTILTVRHAILAGLADSLGKK